MCGWYIITILCTYTVQHTSYYTCTETEHIHICVCGPRRCAWRVCVSVRVVYLYNIMLCTIYTATVGLGCRTKECYLQLSFIRRRVVEFFPFGGRIIIIIIKKLFFFPLLSFLREPVVLAVGGGVTTQNRPFWRGF